MAALRNWAIDVDELVRLREAELKEGKPTKALRDFIFHSTRLDGKGVVLLLPLFRLVADLAARVDGVAEDPEWLPTDEAPTPKRGRPKGSKDKTQRKTRSDKGDAECEER